MDMTPEQQNEFMATLCNQEIVNPEVRERSVVRALAINHVQMAQVISDLRTTIVLLNKENGKIASRVWWLTMVAVLFGGIQAFGVIWTICHYHR